MRNVLLISALLFVAISAFAQKAAKPNVILITVDTLRADHVGAFGAKAVATPAIDSLARDGVLFENAIAQVPLTLASHAAMLTGTYPFSNHVQDFTGEPLAPSFQTVAQAFKRNGYVTGAVVSAFVLDRSWGLARGFDFYYDAFAPASFLEKNIGLVDRRAEESVQQATAWIAKQRSGRRPFFLWLHLYDPHSPYDPPEPFRAQYRSDPYSGEVAYADSQLARFFAELRNKGIYDRSAIVLLSDHGESLGEHGESEHGFFIYRATIHVPFILKLSRNAKAGSRVAAAVEATSVAATLLGAAGVHDSLLERQLQAPSVLDVIGHPDQESAAYSETYYPFSSFGWSPLRSIQNREYQYIDAPQAELYNIAKDSEQTTNLADRQPAVTSVFKENLLGLIRKYPAPEHVQAASNLAPDAIERLRALGYVAYKSPVSAAKIAAGLPDPKSKIREFGAILKAGDAFAQNDFATGRRLLSEVHGSDPEMYLVPFMLGEASLRQQDWNGAITEFEDCLRLAPTFDQAMTGVAQAYFQAGNVEKAKERLRSATAANPQNYRAWYQLGFIAQRNEPRAAAESFRKAIGIQPNFALAHRDLGVLLSQQRDYPAAATHLERAIALGVRDSRIYNLAGVAHSQTKAYAQAIKSFQAALKADPQYAEPHLNMGLAYQRQGKSALARQEYATACRMQPQLCQYVPKQ